jgi:septation ring formation regulator EzrA
MLEKLKRLLGVDTNSSAAIETALAEIDLDALRETQSRIGSERQALLLSGTDEQVLDAERRLDGARLDLERATLAHDALTAKLAEARVKEIEGTYLTAHAETEAARAAWAAKVRRELPKVEKTMASIFEEADAVSQRIRALRRLREPHDYTGDIVDQLYRWLDTFHGTLEVRHLGSTLRVPT